MTYADYTDDLVLFANIPAQADSLLNSLKQAAGGGTGFYMIASKNKKVLSPLLVVSI